MAQSLLRGLLQQVWTESRLINSFWNDSGEQGWA